MIGDIGEISMVGGARDYASDAATDPERPRAADVDGASVRCRVDGAGPLPVLLRGIGRTPAGRDGQHGRLAGVHRVVILDLPGSGGSDRVPPPTTLPAGFVADLP